MNKPHEYGNLLFVQHLTIMPNKAEIIDLLMFLMMTKKTTTTTTCTPNEKMMKTMLTALVICIEFTSETMREI